MQHSVVIQSALLDTWLPISCQRHQRLARAMEASLVASMELGDALQISSLWLWWQRVQSTRALNLMLV